MENKIIAALDIGTTKICVVIARKSEIDDLEIIGVGISPSTGLKKGVVVNIDATTRAIKKAVEEAELMAGVSVNSMMVGIAGSHISGINSRGVIAVSGRGREKDITREDVNRVINTAKSMSIPADREIIHVIPQGFVVDDQDGILDPVGMSGVRLEAEVHIVTGAISSAQNIIKSVKRAGYDVADIILEPMASAEAVLNEDEKELGSVVIDIGGGTTDLVIYVQNSIWHTAVIPIGGNLVTSDISYGIRTPYSSAELIKKQYGCALSDLVDANDYIEVPLVGGRPPQKLSRKMLSQIIEPRMEEIFKYAAEEINKNNYLEKIAAGTVVTGGASLMEGTEELAQRILNHPVRVGFPQGLAGLNDKIESPIHATGVGLAILGSQENHNAIDEKNANIFATIKERMSRWFGEFFQ